MKTTTLICAVILIPSILLAADFSIIYGRTELEYWQTRYPENVQHNFENLIIGSLTPSEKHTLGTVKLLFPLFVEGGDPMTFYCCGNSIICPILSIKFFDDLCIAYAWLTTNNYSVSTISEYLTMVKYRNPADFPNGRFPLPLTALQIPDYALKNPWIDDDSQKILKTAIIWILAHELGHIYHKHQVYEDVSIAQTQEMEADRFATEIMRRLGIAPMGMVPYFMFMAQWSYHRGDFKNDKEWADHLKKKAKHPVTGERLLALAEDLLRDLSDFTRYEQDKSVAIERIRIAAGEIIEIAKILNDQSIQKAFKIIALSTNLDSLRPRRPDQLISSPESSPLRGGGVQNFHGFFRGEYMHYLNGGGKESLPVMMSLTRNGKRVTGRYSFGLGEGMINGIVYRNKLSFEWNWGGNYGNGFLEVVNKNGHLKGSWGYSNSQDNGGTFELKKGEKGPGEKNKSEVGGKF